MSIKPALFLAGEFDEFFLGFDELGHGFLGEMEGFDELVFGSSSAWPSIMMTSVLLPT
jgi:hypothetical protein